MQGCGNFVALQGPSSFLSLQGDDSFIILQGNDSYIDLDTSNGYIKFPDDTIQRTAFVPSGCVTLEQHITTSGDLLNAFPMSVVGSGVFSASGYNISHNLNTLDHWTNVTPAGQSSFDLQAVESIGNIYVQKGLN